MEQKIQPRHQGAIDRVREAVQRTSDSSLGFAAGLALVAAYVVMRTAAAPEPVLIGWIAAATLAAVLAPAAGLTVLAAIGPFTEAVTDDGRITAVPFLIAALGAGLLLALARDRVRHLPARVSLPMILGGALFAGTLIAVGLSAVSFGEAGGLEALRLWVPGIGGGLTVLAASSFIAAKGESRPVLVVVSSITLAALVSVADVIGSGLVREGPLGWLLRSDVGPGRLTGIIPAPNAAAAIFLVGLAMAAAATLFTRRTGVRLLASVVIVILFSALLLTYSRSGLLALVAIGAILAWSYRRWSGVLVTVVAALVVGLAAMLLPELDVIRNVPAWADEDRLAAWGASIAMWIAEPLTGHGFRSFEWLHAQYGSTLDAPHNEWLRFFAEGGMIVGLVALGFVITALVALLRAPGWIPAGSAAALAALFVMASFNNPLMYVQVNVPTFLAVGAGLGLAGLQHRKRASLARVAREETPEESVPRRQRRSLARERKPADTVPVVRLPLEHVTEAWGVRTCLSDEPLA